MKPRFYLILILLLMLCFIASFILIGGMTFLLQKDTTQSSPPLVLFQTPRLNEKTNAGEGIMIYTTSRAEQGLTRMEIWADGAFVSARDWEGENPTFGVLSTMWETQTPGKHILITRAFAADGTQNQTSLTVYTSPAEYERSAPASIFVGKNETLESIALRLGAQIEILEELNPNLKDENLFPGDKVFFPAPPLSVWGEETPLQLIGQLPDQGELPLGDTLVDPYPWMQDQQSSSNAKETSALQVEILSLHTNQSYAALNCYFSTGGGMSQRLPDWDQDQSTDEAFLPAEKGGWDIGRQVVTTVWQKDTVLPVQINCVGSLSGGLDTQDTGIISLSIPPQKWDGIQRVAASMDGEAVFFMNYRVQPDGSAAEDETTQLSVPYGLVLNDDILSWSYYPASIAAFGIYLDQNLIGALPAEERSLRLPDTWLDLPCGESHQIQISALGNPYPNGTESALSNAMMLYAKKQICQQNVSVKFTFLELFENLQNYDPEQIGPIYGTLYANSEIILLDGRCIEEQHCGELYLQPGETYSLSELSQLFANQTSELIVAVPDGQDVQIGFDLYDADLRNMEDRLCHSELTIPYQQLGEEQQGYLEDWVGNNCRVGYIIEPKAGELSESGEYGLPDLQIEEISVDENNGQLQIHLYNAGQAAWAGEDLQFTLRRRSGASLEKYTQPGFVLWPGERAVLQWNELAPPQPQDTCVILDPHDIAPEEGEDQFWSGKRFCTPLPDLMIQDVSWNSQQQVLSIRVQNIGDAAVTGNPGLKIELEDGFTISSPSEWWAGLEIAPNQSVSLEWPGLTNEQREMMKAGYMMKVDAKELIAESREDNNSFNIPQAAWLRLSWYGVNTPYYPPRIGSASQEQYFALKTQIGSSAHKSTLTDWRSGPIQITTGYPETILLTDMEVDLEIAGDEDIYFSTSGALSRLFSKESLGRSSYVLSAEENWGIGREIYFAEECKPAVGEDLGHSLNIMKVYAADELCPGCPPWSVLFLVCRIK